MDDTSELIRAMREMRTAQKKYFKTRSPQDLSVSKDWEKKVDELLARLPDPAVANPEQPRQGTLFG